MPSLRVQSCLDSPAMGEQRRRELALPPEIGQPETGDRLERRIRRVRAIARAHGYAELVLGAWGCGAFGNDPRRTARDFRRALEGEFAGVFSRVVFAVVDWSPERRFLGPFREVFEEARPGEKPGRGRRR